MMTIIHNIEAMCMKHNDILCDTLFVHSMTRSSAIMDLVVHTRISFTINEDKAAQNDFAH